MTGRARRIAVQLVLWAGPLGIAAAALLLLVSAPFFRHGPGVPSAGDERAWGAMWAALTLVGLGGVVGSVAGVAWLVATFRAGRRPGILEWIRTVANLFLGGVFARLWLFP